MPVAVFRTAWRRWPAAMTPLAFFGGVFWGAIAVAAGPFGEAAVEAPPSTGVVVTPVVPPAAIPSPTPLPPPAEGGPLPEWRDRSLEWQDRLREAFAGIEAGARGQLGVHVRDLATGQTVSYRADESWYLASMVKVPVAVAVLRAVDRGDFTLETRLTLRESDRVDGAGATLAHPVGTALSVRWLLGQMIIRSDNTATDMLIGLVGRNAVQAVIADLAPAGIGPITTLADVRRHVYGQLTRQAEQLDGRQLLLLHQQPSDAQRLQVLARETGTSVAAFRLQRLDQAYDAYYREGLNSGRLDAYADFLQAVAQGRALSASSTALLLQLMSQVSTGARRIKAGLPLGTGFAHKTGTQRRRICDAGLVGAGPVSDPGLLVVACVREEPMLLRSERMLREVGVALCRSGLVAEEMYGSTCLARQDGNHHPEHPGLGPARRTAATGPGGNAESAAGP